MATERLLKIGMLVFTAAMAAGCASQSTSVRRLGAESMYCELAEVDVAEIQHDVSTGETHYEVRGCGKKQNFACQDIPRKVVLAAAGWFDLDQRRCRRELL